MKGNWREHSKRLLDLAVSFALSPIGVPVIAACGVAIKLETRGPVFFKQTRVGRNGRKFEIYKLRTMVEGAEHKGRGLYFEENDSRFTRVGLFARRFSLDELPQLINIIRGDMSLVGPRPQLPIIVERHRREYDTILKVKPGVTGLAQINGRNSLTRAQRMRFDIEYAESWSLILDLGIILKTFSVVLTGEGQMNNQSEEDVEQTDPLIS